MPDAPGSLTWYGATPDTSRTETGGDGAGGVNLLDPGSVVLTAVRASTGGEVARARVWIQAGVRTWINLVPRSMSGE